MSNTEHIPIPEGMRRVSKSEFFKALMDDPRDIMPSHASPYFTSWETKGRVVWGWSLPGWRNPRIPAVYALKEGQAS